MFNRLVGNYNLIDFLSFIFPKQNAFEELTHYLPKKNVSFFNMGRDALYYTLLHQKTSSNKRHVIIPSWGCPIILATVHKAGFIPLLLDISAKTLKLNIDNIIEINKQYDINCVILVAENGITYTKQELQLLKNAELTIIADYAIAWQNITEATSSLSDFDIYSGGFSKPVSGLALGILTTNQTINVPKLKKEELPITEICKIFIHFVLQNRSLYRFFHSLIPKDIQTDFHISLHSPSKASASLVSNSLKRILQTKHLWFDIQKKIQLLLSEKKSQAPIINIPDILHTKIIFEKELLYSTKSSHIEYHNQYSYNLLSDQRGTKINSDYENTKYIQENFISFTINHTVIKHQNEFLTYFKHELKK